MIIRYRNVYSDIKGVINKGSPCRSRADASALVRAFDVRGAFIGVEEVAVSTVHLSIVIIIFYPRKD